MSQTASDSEKRVLARLEQNVERAVGLPISQVRCEPIDDQRRRIEAARQKPLSFRVRFPIVGRGNVMRDRTRSHAEVESTLDRILG